MVPYIVRSQADQKTRRDVYQRDKGKCVVCGKTSVHIHEIIGRALLPGAELAETLFSLKNRCCLCPKCHDQAHTVWARVMLLGILRLRYGYKYDEKPFSPYLDIRKV